jgi:hypothetical protein
LPGEALSGLKRRKMGGNLLAEGFVEVTCPVSSTPGDLHNGKSNGIAIARFSV